MREQNLYLKCCHSLELLIYFGKGFHTGNIGSSGQRAAKLIAVKVGGPKKKSAISAISAEVLASAFSLGSSLPGFESFSKFDRQ